MIDNFQMAAVFKSDHSLELYNVNYKMFLQDNKLPFINLRGLIAGNK